MTRKANFDLEGGILAEEDMEEEEETEYDGAQDDNANMIQLIEDASFSDSCGC